MNPRPISTPGSTSESITDPGKQQARSRTRWIVIVSVIGVLIIAAVVLSLVARGGTGTTTGDEDADDAEETVLSEEDTKATFHRYLSYLFFGDESNTNYDEVWDKIRKDPTTISDLYASQVLASNSADERSEYFTTLNDIFTPFADSYNGDSSVGNISAFYHDYALLPNLTPDSLAATFMQNGESSAETYVDSIMTTESTNETVLQYVEAQKAMLKSLIAFFVVEQEYGCVPTSTKCDLFTSGEQLPEDLAQAYATAVSTASQAYTMQPALEDLQTNAIMALHNIYEEYNNSTEEAE